MNQLTYVLPASSIGVDRPSFLTSKFTRPQNSRLSALSDREYFYLFNFSVAAYQSCARDIDFNYTLNENISDPLICEYVHVKERDEHIRRLEEHAHKVVAVTRNHRFIPEDRVASDIVFSFVTVGGGVLYSMPGRTNDIKAIAGGRDENGCLEFWDYKTLKRIDLDDEGIRHLQPYIKSFPIDVKDMRYYPTCAYIKTVLETTYRSIIEGSANKIIDKYPHTCG